MKRRKGELAVRVSSMKEGLKVSKEMVLQLSFERVKCGEDSNVSRKSIPETWCTVRKSFLTNCRKRLKGRGNKKHVKRTRKSDFRRKRSRSKTVDTLES